MKRFFIGAIAVLAMVVAAGCSATLPTEIEPTANPEIVAPVKQGGTYVGGG